MFDLKRLHLDAVPAALAKAERYRLLNEPRAAESICLDILEVDPRHQQALATLVLALTDQFARNADVPVDRVREILPRLTAEYDRAYYGGIICERWAKALITRSNPGYGPIVHGWLSEAMRQYEQAERLRPQGNDDPILRWNACARLIMRHPEVRPAEKDDTQYMLE
jgi:hypothetical protein